MQCILFTGIDVNYKMDYGDMYVAGRRNQGTTVHVSAVNVEATHANVILDNFKSLDEVREAIRKQGLDTCNLIFGWYYVFEI